MSELISVSGKKGAGKDTVGRFLVEDHGYTRLGFADAVKEMAAKLEPWLAERLLEQLDLGVRDRGIMLFTPEAWDQAKEQPLVRGFLQQLGTEIVREILGEDVWVNALAQKVERIDGPVVITDARLPNELDWVRSQGGECWLVERPSLEDDGDGHVTEHAWIGEPFDAVMHNYDGFRELRDQVWLAVRLGATTGRDV